MHVLIKVSLFERMSVREFKNDVIHIGILQHV